MLEHRSPQRGQRTASVPQLQSGIRKPCESFLTSQTSERWRERLVASTRVIHDFVDDVVRSCARNTLVETTRNSESEGLLHSPHLDPPQTSSKIALKLQKLPIDPTQVISLPTARLRHQNLSISDLVFTVLSLANVPPEPQRILRSYRDIIGTLRCVPLAFMPVYAPLNCSLL